MSGQAYRRRRAPGHGCEGRIKEKRPPRSSVNQTCSRQSGETRLTLLALLTSHMDLIMYAGYTRRTQLVKECMVVDSEVRAD